MRKLTQEEVIARFREVHGDKYNYSKVEYKGANTKVCIICPEHGEFWQTPDKHLIGQGCSICGRNIGIQKRTSCKDEFIKKARIVHRDRYNYSKVEYVDCKTKVKIICKEHGGFWQTPSNHIFGRGCPKCRAEKLSKMTAPTKEVFIKKARLKHGDLYDYSKVEYINSSIKVEIICKEHGSFWQTPAKHLNGCGCPLCGNKKIGEKLRKSKELFISQANIVHNFKYDYSKVNYVNSDTNVCIICKEHGEFFQSPKHHLSGHGCPKCYKSHGELKIEEYLKRNKIEYKPQYNIQFDNKMFSVNSPLIDFYLPKYNTFIEFNGIQHYEYNSFFHRDKDTFKIQIERDKRLKEYCKKNKINLIVIKYDQINKIDKILNNKLKLLNYVRNNITNG